MSKQISTKAIFYILPLLGVLSANSSYAAVDWPWQQAAEQKTKSANVTENSTSSIGINPTQNKPQNTSRPLERTATAGLNAPVSEAKSSAPIQNSFTIPAPQRNANYEEAVKLQAKLTDVLRVSAEIDRFNRSKVTAVQSMVDKARMNQKILALLATPGDAASKLKKTDADKILLSKKVRGMREEAEKQIALAQSRKNSVLSAGHKAA